MLFIILTHCKVGKNNLCFTDRPCKEKLVAPLRYINLRGIGEGLGEIIFVFGSLGIQVHSQGELSAVGIAPWVTPEAF